MLVRAIVWSYAGKIIRQIGTFGVSIVLARLLAPEEFGAAGIVLALIAMVNVIVDFGFGGALLQRKDFDDKLASSIFYFSVFVGLVMFTIAQFGARYIAEIYSLPELEDAIRLMAISFVITPLLGVLQIKMEKALRFDLIVKQLLPASLISGLGAILAAFLEYGVLSLIIQNLLLNVSLTFFLWKKERWLPRHRFDIDRLKSVWSFSSMSFLDNVVSAVFNQLDVLFIGKVLSASILGFYSRAKSLNDLVVSYSSQSLGTVVYPYVSTHQDDLSKVRESYLKIMDAVLFVALCMSVALYMTSDELIPLLFGEVWRPSVAMFKYLALVAFVNPLIAISTKTILGLGDAKLNFLLNTVRRVLLVFALLAAYYGGIEAYLQWYVGLMVSVSILYLWKTSRKIDLSFKGQLVILLKYSTISIMSGFITLFVSSWIVAHDWLLFLFKGLFTVIAYFALSFLFQLRTPRTILSVVTRNLPRL